MSYSNCILDVQSCLGVSSGLFFASPVSRKHSIAKERMDAIIAQALRDIETLGIYGSNVTPFVLDKIADLTQGDTIAANRSLIETNVVRGAKVAVELAAIWSQNNGKHNS